MFQTAVLIDGQWLPCSIGSEADCEKTAQLAVVRGAQMAVVVREDLTGLDQAVLADFSEDAKSELLRNWRVYRPTTLRSGERVAAYDMSCGAQAYSNAELHHLA